MNNKTLLLQSARGAAEKAYCPYSRFAVGAAVLTSDGRVFSGANVENSSYGLTVCAERTAIFQAVVSGAREISALAVSCLKGDPEQPNSLMPCGACLQVMEELLAPGAEIIVDGIGVFALRDLLPRPFHLTAAVPSEAG